MDRCAPELIAQAAPLRFGTVHSSSELEAVYRLRYRVALARGWAKEEDFPEGLEYDGFEGRAITVAAWNEECLAGTVRLVLPVDGELLPTEEAFGLRIEPVGLVGD
ncbi:MAG: hypothetical protein JO112_04400, partial [Planctomycetes bacterium]|nr:hypothetical protein [Planctomycetota bacterium]